MDRRLVFGLALAAGLSVTACGERTHEPSLQDSGTLSNVIPAACSPTAFNSLIAGYFVNPQQQAVKTEKDLMIAALQANDGDLAKVHGFNILREISSRSKAVPRPDPATGSALAVEVLECIYENLSDTEVIEKVPGPNFFVNALTRNGGGFEVRGATDDPAAPVQAAGGNPLKVIAGIAPPLEFRTTPLTSAWWVNSLDHNPDKRVLFYGERGPTTGSYHWSVVPRSSTFQPPLVFTTCVDDAIFAEDANSAMLRESGVGVLAFEDATYVGCGGDPAVTASTGLFGALRGLADVGRKLLTPQPAAAAAVMPGTVGGSAKTAKSLFDVKLVPTVDVKFTSNPDPIGTLVVNQSTFDLTVTIKSGADFVNGTLVSLALEANNGVTNSVLFQKDGQCNGDVPSAVTGDGSFAAGTVEFKGLCITKTGSVKVIMLADAVDRVAQGLARTPKIKVIPPPR